MLRPLVAHGHPLPMSVLPVDVREALIVSIHSKVRTVACDSLWHEVILKDKKADTLGKGTAREMIHDACALCMLSYHLQTMSGSKSVMD